MLEYLTSPLYREVYLWLGLVGFAFAVFADHMQTVARYRGILLEQIAQGYNLAMKVMVLNRLGAVFFFLLIAFSVDSGVQPELLSRAFSFVILLLVLPTGILMCWLQTRMQTAGYRYQVFDYEGWDKGILVASFLATIFNLLGLTLPWVAGAKYPEYRLTLANSSFLFNTIFTIVNVFYIEHRFARLADNGSNEVHGFVSGIIIARFFALVVVSVVFWVIS